MPEWLTGQGTNGCIGHGTTGGDGRISTVYGNTQGLKPSQIRRLEKLSHRRIPPEHIITHELARQLTELSREVNRQIGLLIDRKGRIVAVVVGNAHQIVWPRWPRVRSDRSRFCGLRCVHTHLNGEPLTEDDVTDLALLRLDLMAAIDVLPTGLPGVVRSAHLMPVGPGNGDLTEARRACFFLDPAPPSQLKVNFLELIQSLEEELARNRLQVSPHETGDRAILVGVTTGSLGEAEESLEELRELARSAGVVVLDAILQRRKEYDPTFLLGKGKLQELIIRALQVAADMIIFDQDLTPSQVRAINAATDLKVLDRTQLILDIFAQRARSREGKIQVELAQLRYLLPRLTESDSGLSRLTGGIGGRGPGETKLEMDRRRIRDRIAHLEAQIDEVRTHRQQQRRQRQRHQLPMVSIVGYTNAGKSTLLNALTGAGVLAEGRMFATLDPTRRRLWLSPHREIILCDTVGFIRNLPPDLIQAFRATLEEIAESTLILHLADASNPRVETHLATVEETLHELGFGHIPRLLVFNKQDVAEPETVAHLCRRYQGLSLSAVMPETLGPLLERLQEMLS
jgi:GTP-binding protein HflX